MSNFYCNICEEDVSLQNGKCPKCKTDWGKIVNSKVSDESTFPTMYFAPAASASETAVLSSS